MTRSLIQINNDVREMNDAEFADWQATQATRDVEQAAAVRQERNDKLKDSDWTQVADAPVDQAAWAIYRQALRDVTGQEGFPWTITWPEQP